MPAKLVDATRALLERRLTALPAAEMAEALSRHQDQEGLARDFAHAAFASAMPIDGATASARWWLAERWLQLRNRALPEDPEDIRQARLLALSTAVGDDAHARAMALEAVGRSVDRLIVDTPDNLEAARSVTEQWVFTELYVWRAVLAIAAALLVMFNIDRIVAQLDAATGVAKPSALVFQAIFGLGCAVIAFASTTLMVELAKVHKRMEMPKLERAAEIFIPLVAGLAGAILHQG
jgi:hypothetical protein